MARKQGFNILSRGINRGLTPSEIERGYIFVSKDKTVRDILGDAFCLKLGGERIEEQKIDGSGRIFLGMKNIKKLGKRNISILLNKNMIIIN